MSAPLLLVLGDHELAGPSNASAAAFAWIRSVISAMPTGTVLHGGGSGPDQWAARLGRRYGHRVVAYLPHGSILGGEALRWWPHLSDEPERKHYLRRDVAMVYVARAHLLTGRGPVAVLGSYGPHCADWKHALRVATSVGLWTEARVYS